MGSKVSVEKLKWILLGYMVGFFDGEGCVHTMLWKNRNRLGVKLKVSNTDRKPLELFQSVFGGTITESGPKMNNKRKKPFYSFVPNSERSLMILRALDPYLITKKENSGLAIKFLSKEGARRSENKELEDLFWRIRVNNFKNKPNGFKKLGRKVTECV